MPTRNAAFTPGNETHDARHRRPAYSSEILLIPDASDDGLNAALAAMSYLLEPEGAPPLPLPTVPRPRTQEAIGVGDGKRLAIDPRGHESVPARVPGWVAVDPHTRVTVRPERLEVPDEARGSLMPAIPPLRLLAPLPPPAAEQAPPVDSPVAATHDAAAAPASARGARRLVFPLAGKLAIVGVVASACIATFFYVRYSYAMAPAGVTSIAALASSPVAGPLPTATPSSSVTPSSAAPTADEQVHRAPAPALAARPRLRLLEPVPFRRTVAVRPVGERPPQSLTPPAPPVVVVKQPTSPLTGPVLLEDR